MTAAIRPRNHARTRTTRSGTRLNINAADSTRQPGNDVPGLQEIRPEPLRRILNFTRQSRYIQSPPYVLLSSLRMEP